MKKTRPSDVFAQTFGLHRQASEKTRRFA